MSIIQGNAKGGLATVDLTDGLIAHYPLNEDSQANDWTTDYDSTAYNGVVFDDICTTFDGVNDYILLPTTAKYASDGFSFSVWLNNIGTTSLLQYRSSGNGNNIEVGPTQIRIYSNGSTVYSSTYSTTSWRHFIINVRSDTVVDIYIDGILFDTLSPSVMDNQFDNEFRVGVRELDTGSLSGYATGSVANIRHYNKVLTQSEIDVLYAEGVKPSLPQPTTEGLIAHYPLTGTAEDTTSNYDGTEYGGLTYTDDSIRGAVCNFDGSDDYISLPTSMFTAGQSFTICCWIYEDDFNSAENSIIQVAGGTYPNDFAIVMGGGKVSDNTNARLYMRNYTTNALYVDGRNSLTHTSGTWRQLVMSYDGATLSGYEDGVLLDSGNITMSNPLPSISQNTIGVSSNTDRFLDGRLSNLRIYDRALSADEISTIYQTERVEHPITIDDGLVAYYPLESNSYDNSQNQYDLADGTGITYDGTSASYLAQNSYTYSATAPVKLLNGLDTYSISCWVYMETQGWAGILTNNNLGWQRYGIEFIMTSAEIVFSHVRSDSVSTNNTVGTPQRVGEWHHYVAHRIGKAIKLYEDGMFIHSNTLHYNETNNYLNSEIGRYYNANPNTPQGVCRLSQLRCYNRALSAEEIGIIYNLEKSKFGIE